MLTVKTYLKDTGLKGIGLFAGEEIPSGCVWWKYDDNFDLVVSNTKFRAYCDLQKEFLNTYGAWQVDNTMYLCVDNARFVNHSDNPNTSNIYDDSGIVIFCVAKNTIMNGEEITCDYREICKQSKGLLGFENKENV